MIIDEEQYLAHYGILRKSGRYPWGSGKTQSARNKSFLDTVEELRRKGLTDAEIAKGFSTDAHPFSSTQLRALRSIALNQQKQEKIAQAQKLKEKGYSNVAIAQRMYGDPKKESTVRGLLAPGEKDKADVLTATAEMLRRQVEEKKYLDVGLGVNLDLPISSGGSIGLPKGKFDTAVAILQEEGYKKHYVKIQQIGTGKETTLQVLTKKGVPYSEVYQNRGNIGLISEHTDNHGRGYESNFRPPTSIKSSRVEIRYAENGGDKADGLIYVRPGAKDLDMGKSHYAQVRIMVDGTHYLKGMAVYKDDLPEGTDLVFNTNKKNTGRKKDAMKEASLDEHGKVDMKNPFGASISRQSGHLNIVNEEGDWDNWSRNLSSQMLSKQVPALAKQQLNMTYERRLTEYDGIVKLTNPSVKRKLLESFADETDSASVHLKAAALPRTANKVLLPVNSVKVNEIYAPSYHNGERVVLIRHPHGGTFEIPELTVNNKNPEAKKILGTAAKDAVAIHHSVAKRLSGADFDGDTVLVIPNGNKSVKSSPALEGLKNFDPQTYKRDPNSGVPKMTNKRKQPEMGKISNLITDMTIQGAGREDLARAVRHSMVVIDSEKHDLDIRRSAKDNGILDLKRKYQAHEDPKKSGASTIISRAKSPIHLPEMKPRPAKEGGPIDAATGRKMFVPTGKTRIDRKTGKEVPVTRAFKKLAVTDNAHTLVSKDGGTRIEHVYADHSNQLKSLANQARKEMISTHPIKVSESAKRTYAPQVASLTAKLNLAKKNAPLERKAQALANQVVSQKRQANPDMDADDLKKVKNQALDEMRQRTGAKKDRVDIEPREWEAIQAGAVSPSKLDEILNHSNLDTVKKLATPREVTLMTSTKTARAKSMLASGFTQAEVASHLGVSLSTLKATLNE